MKSPVFQNPADSFMEWSELYMYTSPEQRQAHLSVFMRHDVARCTHQTRYDAVHTHSHTYSLRITLAFSIVLLLSSAPSLVVAS